MGFNRLADRRKSILMVDSFGNQSCQPAACAPLFSGSIMKFRPAWYSPCAHAEPARTVDIWYATGPGGGGLRSGGGSVKKGVSFGGVSFSEKRAGDAISESGESDLDSVSKACIYLDVQTEVYCSDLSDAWRWLMWGLRLRSWTRRRTRRRPSPCCRRCTTGGGKVRPQPSAAPVCTHSVA